MVEEAQLYILMAKRTNRTSKMGRPRRVIQSNEENWIDEEHAYEYQESPVLKKIVTYAAYLLVAILLFLFISKRASINQINADKVPEQKRSKAKQIELGETYSAFKSLDIQGDKAAQEEDYFKAIFNYRQALSLDEGNIQTYEKLAAALGKSCEGGNEMHCNSIEKTKQRILQLKKGLKEKTSD